jgi:hypothetical protein
MDVTLDSPRLADQAVGAATTSNAFSAAAGAPSSSPMPDGLLPATVWVLRRIATFPTRFLQRLRLLDQILSEDAERRAAAPPPAYSVRTTSNGEGIAETTRQQVQGGLPGPWSFFISGYGIGIITMVRVMSVRVHSALS